MKTLKELMDQKAEISKQIYALKSKEKKKQNEALVGSYFKRKDEDDLILAHVLELSPAGEPVVTTITRGHEYWSMSRRTRAYRIHQWERIDKEEYMTFLNTMCRECKEGYQDG